MGIAEDGGGQGTGAHKRRRVIARGAGDGLDEPLFRELHVGPLGEFGGHGLVVVDDGMGMPGTKLGQGLRTAGSYDVAPEKQVRPAGGDACRVEVLGPLGEAQMADHGPVLLGQSRHVEDRDTASLQVPRHAEKRPDGDDARAPDAGDDNAVGVPDFRHFGLRQDGEGGIAAAPGTLAERAAVNGDEARAETLEAREVLVA